MSELTCRKYADKSGNQRISYPVTDAAPTTKCPVRRRERVRSRRVAGPGGGGSACAERGRGCGAGRSLVLRPHPAAGTPATTASTPAPPRRAPGQTAAERIFTHMTDDKLSGARSQLGQEASPVRCQEMARTERGWERCHCDEHAAGARHHVRDRSWVTVENTPRLRLGQPCTGACRWPDQIQPYRGTTKVRGY
jgi:hypothetical protein